MNKPIAVITDSRHRASYHLREHYNIIKSDSTRKCFEDGNGQKFIIIISLECMIEYKFSGYIVITNKINTEHLQYLINIVERKLDE